MPLSGHVYCVPAAFKMTEQVEQWICIKFCIQLKHSSKESIQRIQKAAAMCLLMHHVSCSFLAKHQITQVTHSPLQPRITALRFLAFPKTKITFAREEISDHWWDSEKYNEAADGDWENCVRPQGAYFEGDWGIIVLCTVFLVSCIFFNKCLCFSYYMAGYLLDRPCIYTHSHTHIHV